jgi:hypothetical protein
MMTAGMPVRKLQNMDAMPATMDQTASLLVLARVPLGGSA